MVYIFLAPGFEEAEALVPADLLRRAGIDTALVGTERGPVVGGHGIAVLPDMELPQVALEDAEMLVLPGGGRGVENLACCPQVEQLIQSGRRPGHPHRRHLRRPHSAGPLGPAGGQAGRMLPRA